MKAVGIIPEAVPEAGRAGEVSISDGLEAVSLDAVDVVLADAEDQTVETTIPSFLDNDRGDQNLSIPYGV